MEAIRKYLLNDADFFSLVGNAIYFVEKPQEIENDVYIIYKTKPISGGYVKNYQIEFNIVGKDLAKLMQIQNRLIYLLDDPRNEKHIENIYHTELLNGGGIVKNPDTGNYEIILYFLYKI